MGTCTYSDTSDMIQDTDDEENEARQPETNALVRLGSQRGGGASARLTEPQSAWIEPTRREIW